MWDDVDARKEELLSSVSFEVGLGRGVGFDRAVAAEIDAALRDAFGGRDGVLARAAYLAGRIDVREFEERLDVAVGLRYSRVGRASRMWESLLRGS